MNFITSVSTCLSKYFDFSGRAQRSEFWWFYLFTFLLSFAASRIDPSVADSAETILLAVLAIPVLAAGCRRLHDTDRRGWWQLLPLSGFPLDFVSATAGALVTLAGTLVLIIIWSRKGSEGENRFGPDPLQPFDPTVFD